MAECACVARQFVCAPELNGSRNRSLQPSCSVDDGLSDGLAAWTDALTATVATRNALAADEDIAAQIIVVVVNRTGTERWLLHELT
jgi:hypothetical protein